MIKYFSFKKIILFFCIILFFNCFSASYNYILLKYLNYIKNNQLKKAYDLLSKIDKEIVSYEDFSTLEESIYKDLLKNNTTYKIKNSILSATKERVMIEVEIYQPDLVLLFAKFPVLTKQGVTKKEIDKISKSINIKEYLTIYWNRFLKQSISYYSWY